jgi:flagellar motor switch protein FliN/FliY
MIDDDAADLGGMGDLGGGMGGGGTGGSGGPPATGNPNEFDELLGDVPLDLSVELGRVTMALREIAARLGPGSVIELNKLTGETLDVRVNERLVAHAEAVAVGERYGIRIVEIVGLENKS